MDSTASPLDRASTDVEALPLDECWRRLAGQTVGRLAFVDAGEPTVLPFNYAVVGRSIVVRTTGWTALGRLGSCATVAFEVDQTSDADRTGWSVVARGALVDVDDERDLAELAMLTPSPWIGGRRDHVVRLEPWSVTGREIRTSNAERRA